MDVPSIPGRDCKLGNARKHRRPHSHEPVQAVENMRRAWAAARDALATVRGFNPTSIEI